MKEILTALLYVKRDGIHLSRVAQRDLNQIHLTTSPTPGRNGHEQLQLEQTQNACVQRGVRNDSHSIYQLNSINVLDSWPEFGIFNLDDDNTSVFVISWYSQNV